MIDERVVTVRARFASLSGLLSRTKQKVFSSSHFFFRFLFVFFGKSRNSLTECASWRFKTLNKDRKHLNNLDTSQVRICTGTADSSHAYP